MPDDDGGTMSTDRSLARPRQQKVTTQIDEKVHEVDERRRHVGQSGEREVLDALAELVRQQSTIADLVADHPSRQQLAATFRGLADAIDHRRQSLGPVRNAASHDAVLQAAMDILAEGGSASFDAIAKRARAGKPTLYRRWPTRGELFCELVDTRIMPLLPGVDDIPNLGSIARDLEEFLAQAWRAIEEHGAHAPIVWHILEEARRQPSIAKRLDAYMTQRRAVFEALLRRGIERGQLPATFDLASAWRLYVGFNISCITLRSHPDRSELHDIARMIVQETVPLDNEKPLRAGSVTGPRRST
jgi:AcrR family transcriptional regulator